MQKGALRQLADKEKIKSYIIADDIGGRFSVLSAVGLLPIAVAGFDINEFLKGASDAQNICLEPSLENPAIKYAAIRNLLYAMGHKIEIFVNYNHKLMYLAEWWKQLLEKVKEKKIKVFFQHLCLLQPIYTHLDNIFNKEKGIYLKLQFLLKKTLTFLQFQKMMKILIN